MKRKRVSKAIVHQPGAQLYERFVEAIKERIQTAQIKAALAANVADPLRQALWIDCAALEDKLLKIG
jgi:hypothetical protein